MHEYAAPARRKLATLPSSPARKNFDDLIEFIINRKK
jgi:geranylgeranyl pyrophosphate synthase